MGVTAALIVANEADTLARCLTSIREWVDEIVIVDTGSRDRTRDIARRYTRRIYDFVWHRDFAEAREFSFRHAPTDWVFWLDADDVVEHADRIRGLLHHVPRDVKGFYWRYIYHQDECGTPTCELWRERLVRNDHTFHWSGRVHEVLVPVHPVRFERSDDVTIVHQPDLESRERHSRRNIEILCEEYAHRLEPEPRLLLYLGYEYRDLHEWDEALYYLSRYVHVSQWEHEKYAAQISIAYVYQHKHEYHPAIEAAMAALKLLPEWPQAYFSLASSYYFLHDWAKVVEWSDVGRRLNIPDTLSPINLAELKYGWIVYYTNALYHLGRIEDALEWTRIALERCPGIEWHVENERVFRQALEEQQAAPRARRQ
jgi:glycosyltransferase involved in cell wall biosynthesis